MAWYVSLSYPYVVVVVVVAVSLEHTSLGKYLVHACARVFLSTDMLGVAWYRIVSRLS